MRPPASCCQRNRELGAASGGATIASGTALIQSSRTGVSSSVLPA